MQILSGLRIPFLSTGTLSNACKLHSKGTRHNRMVFKNRFPIVCIFYFEVPFLTLQKVLEFSPPPFPQRNSHSYLSYDQENSQNLPASWTQAAHAPSTSRPPVQLPHLLQPPPQYLLLVAQNTNPLGPASTFSAHQAYPLFPAHLCTRVAPPSLLLSLSSGAFALPPPHPSI